MSKFSRRDFLKLFAGFSAGIALSGLRQTIDALPVQASGKPNIIILLLDAMSANALSLYSYPRETTPNLSRFAQRATVYHAHYAAGNYTTPGAASILTGMLPWHHRAINLRGPVRRDFVGKDIFALMGPDYYRAAFTQNMFADVFLRQFHANIDMHVPLTSFRLDRGPSLVSEVFPSDPLVSYYAFDNFQDALETPATLASNYLNWLYARDAQKVSEAVKDDYPYGPPTNTYNYFYNDVVFGGVAQIITKLTQQAKPFFAYLHLYSPHQPYAPRKEFVGIFPHMDFIRKPFHKLSNNHLSQDALYDLRTLYDEFIANVDAEFGKLLNAMDQLGILENSYVFVTSDHGDLFERGEHGHLTYLLYDNILHIPLIVSSPGQKTRRDIYASTNSADLLPTILSLLGRDLPDSLDGKTLPGLGGKEDLERSIFTIEAKESSAFLPLTKASISMIKGDYKIIYYFGYPKKLPISFELYNLRDDADELNNLFAANQVMASRMKEELLDALDASNRSIRQVK
jgi:arylsulfatase A-like enzyme